MMRLAWLPLSVLLLSVPSTRADDKPVRRTKLHVMVTGLFQPDREADLRALFETLPQFTLANVNYDRAEMTVALNPAEVWPNEKPERFPELLDHQLRNASHGSFGVRPLRTVPLKSLQRVEIPISGLDCKGCSFAAYRIVAQMPGVDRATASFKTGKLVAFIDPAATDPAKLVKALKKGHVDVVGSEK